MATKREIRGVQSQNEIEAQTRYVDVRSARDKFKEDLSQPKTYLLYVGIPLAIAFIFPSILEIGVALALFFLLWGKKLQEKVSLPFKMPQSTNILDPHELSLKDGKPTIGQGIGYFGKENSTEKELWFTNSDLRTHILMFGSTGAGKTEALLSLAYNALVWGSGFVYVDGKGSSKLYAQIYGMARQMGREDDVLVINYMTGNKDLFGPQETKMSNTMNPFATGSANSLTQLVVSLMDEGGSDGIWKGRAMSLIAALMAALVYMRDIKEVLLDVEIIRDYLTLDKIIDLCKRKDLPTHIAKATRGYLQSIPGYVESAGKKQSDTTMEQHGYLQMQFTKVLSTLADSYAHIFKTNLGEVDFWDVVVNRRILVVLLPALEFSEPELANLGKIIIASLRAMMATGLGSTIEGTKQTVVDVNPTNGNTPFITILDEYGYYAVKGSAVMPAQARSLGFCMCFAGQDYPSFKKASPEEAAAIAANCNIKICLKLEDPQETFELFKAAAGQGYVTVKSGFDSVDGSLMGGGQSYKGMKNVNIDMRDRIDLRDLQTQKEGDAHILFAGSVIRAKFFFANPVIAKEIRVNYFLRVEPPEKQDLLDLQIGVKELLEKITNVRFQEEAEQAITPCPELVLVRRWMDESSERSLLERAITALAENGLANKEQSAALTSMLNQPSRPSTLNVFNGRRLEEAPQEDDDDEDMYLEEDEVRRHAESIELLGGASVGQAKERSYDMVEDMKIATSYGKSDAPDPMQMDELINMFDDLNHIVFEDKKDAE